MTEIEQEHAQAIDLTQERIKRLEKDMAHATKQIDELHTCLLYTSPSPRDGLLSRMPSSA